MSRVTAMLAVMVFTVVGGNCRKVTTVASEPTIDGLLTDVAENEAERDGKPPLALRNTSGDTLIYSRKTPGLPKNIDSMTDHELVTYLNSLRYKTGGWNTQTANVGCVHGSIAGKPKCTGTDSAHVLIQPEAGMNKREIRDLPPFGMVVARIINDAPGDRDAVNYGYPAQRKTWWMVVDSAGIPRSRFFIRTYAPGPPAIAYVTTSRPYTRCNHPDRPGRPARAKFWTCPESAAESSYSFRGDRVVPNRHEASLEAYVHAVGFGVPSSPSSPTLTPLALLSNWVDCGAGCCASQ
ncbi:MAG TPA: hypothetical protein VFN39_10860 [Gemmatimonadaceae bacterium]|nr:hypothetical protein [Gemmatimonadaceae bacterium]